MSYEDRVALYLEKIKENPEEFESISGIDQSLIEEARAYTYEEFINTIKENTGMNNSDIREEYPYTSFSDNISNGVNSEYPEGTYSAIINTETHAKTEHKINGKPAVYKWTDLQSIIQSLGPSEIVLQMDGEQLFFPLPSTNGGKRKTRKTRKMRKTRRKSKKTKRAKRY